MRCEIKQSLDFRCPENMDASKKKSVAMIDSNSESDSDMSESEFKNLISSLRLKSRTVSKSAWTGLFGNFLTLKFIFKKFHVMGRIMQKIRLLIFY